jgi:hypothetical protein
MLKRNDTLEGFRFHRIEIQLHFRYQNGVVL